MGCKQKLLMLMGVCQWCGEERRIGAPEKEGCPTFRWRVRADVGH